MTRSKRCRWSHESLPRVMHLKPYQSRITRTVGVSASPVAADHLHTRVGAEPVGEVCCVPPDQHVHRSVPAGQIDQHRAVMMTATQRELINTKNSYQPDRRIRQATDQPQQRRPAHRHTQLGGKSGSRPASEGQPDRDHCSLQADTATWPFLWAIDEIVLKATGLARRWPP